MNTLVVDKKTSDKNGSYTEIVEIDLSKCEKNKDYLDGIVCRIFKP